MIDKNRRCFLHSASTGIVLSSAPAFIPNLIQAAPSQKLHHAVIGAGGQGNSHTRGFNALKNECNIVAICDVDPERRTKTAESIPNQVQQYEDYRHILGDESIDTISIATPDHWHAKIAIEAMLAGKHVYVEKPCSHNIREGELLLKAAAKTGKCVQHGTQSRSGEGIMNAIRFLREGRIGQVRLAKAINHQLRRPIGRANATQPPAGVNYNLWLGPAPQHSFTRNRWHYNWHWFWDYGTGDAGNDGIHQIDIARWGLGVGHPKAITGIGGQLFYDDDHQTPDTQVITFEYGQCYLVFEMRLWTDYKMEGHDNGVVFYGDKGKLEIGREGCFVYLIGEDPKKIGGGSDFNANLKNFLACVRDNDPSSLNAPIEEGVLSAALCHWANIITRTGRSIVLNDQHHPQNDDEAAELMDRTYRKGFEIPAL